MNDHEESLREIKAAIKRDDLASVRKALHTWCDHRRLVKPTLILATRFDRLGIIEALIGREYLGIVLCVAAKKGHLKIVRWVLAHHPEPDALDRALVHAAEAGKLEVCRAIWGHGRIKEFNARPCSKWAVDSARLAAMNNGHASVFRLLAPVGKACAPREDEDSADEETGLLG